MATLSDGARALRDELLSHAPDVPEWSTPEDIARRSFEDFASQGEVARQLRSSGRIRLTGAGVDGHSASLDPIGSVMSSTQRLISATGAALRNIKTLKGALSTELQASTRLRLTANPGLGSIVLDIAPEASPESELTPGGQLPMEERRHQLADDAANEVLRVIDSIHEVQADDDSSVFLEELTALGPRVAAALRDFAQTLSRAEFDTSIEWMEPREPTARAAITSNDAARIVRIVRNRKLDAEPVYIEGTLRTKTDISRLQIETETGELVAVDAGDITREMQRHIDLGDYVRILANMIVSKRAGGTDTVTYVGVSIEKIEA